MSNVRPDPFCLTLFACWLGCIEQNTELEEMSRNGYLYCGIYHSSKKTAVVQRVVINNEHKT